jgi:hypothetical protein
LFYTYKHRYTEEAKSDTIDPGFNFDEVETHKKRQVYNNILPFADRFDMKVDGVDHILFDHHCVRMGCTCTECYIEIVPITPDGKVGEPAATVLLDHAKREWQSPPKDNTPCDRTAWRQRVENEFPNFYAQIEYRQARLQAIYANCLNRQLKQQAATLQKEEMALLKKFGRNDLCPCGSGKKYKKCCMNSAAVTARRAE